MKRLSALLTTLACSLALTMGCEDPSLSVSAAQTLDSDSSPAADAPSRPGAEESALAFSQADGTIGFTGSKVTGSHDGGFKQFKGTATLVDGDPAESRFEVEIDAGSLFADGDRVTTHLKSADFFDVERFPTSTFRSRAIAKSQGAGATHRITGDLTLHGVTKTIAFPATIEVDAEHVRLQATFSIDRRDFGIDYAGAANNLIRDGVVLRLDFELAR